MRHAGLAAVAVTDRFALASLLFFDMRSVLRDLAAGRRRERRMPPKPHRVLLDRVSGYADEAAAYMRRRRVARRPSPASTTPRAGPATTPPTRSPAASSSSRRAG